MVALDPKTGAVLAMVTSPTYDPNEIASHDIEAAEQGLQPPGQAIRSGPLSNRAAREIYPPGSTFKLVTAAAALADGMTANTKVASPDRLQAARHHGLPAESARNCGGTEVDLTQALRVSCNTAFANLGLEARAGQAARAGGEVRLQRSGTWPTSAAWPASSPTTWTRRSSR